MLSQVNAFTTKLAMWAPRQSRAAARGMETQPSGLIKLIMVSSTHNGRKLYSYGCYVFAGHVQRVLILYGPCSWATMHGQQHRGRLVDEAGKGNSPKKVNQYNYV
jgi:hypothetical protein